MLIKSAIAAACLLVGGATALDAYDATADYITDAAVEQQAVFYGREARFIATADGRETLVPADLEEASHDVLPEQEGTAPRFTGDRLVFDHTDGVCWQLTIGTRGEPVVGEC